MEFLLTFILVLVCLGYLLRLLSPYLLRWFVNRMSKNLNNQAENNSYYYNRENRSRQRPEGEVRVEQQHRQNKVVDQNMGDYVDFEDVN